MSLNLWQEAAESMKPKWQEQLQALKTISCGPEELIQIVQKSQDLCRSKQWECWKSNGQRVYIRDILEKVVVWLEKIDSVGSTIASYDQVHAALPWAGAQFLIKTATSDIKKYGAMLESVETVVNIVGRYGIMEQLYCNALISDKSASDAASRMKNAIRGVYSSILTFLCKANSYFTQGSLQRFASSAFQLIRDSDVLTHEIMANDAKVAELRLLLDTEIALTHNAQVIDAIENGVNNVQLLVENQLREVLDDLERPIKQINILLQSIKDGLDRQERRKILQWISPERYQEHHKTIFKNKLDGTGLWLFKKPEYHVWRRFTQRSLLWLYGDRKPFLKAVGIPLLIRICSKAGVGKSVLVSLVIDQLSKELQGSSEKLAYFYCTRESTEPTRSNPTEILLSILKQLSSTGAQNPIHTAVVDKWLERQDEGTDYRLDILECTELIIETTKGNSAFIVIDALDECDLLRRHELLEALDEIVQRSENIVKVLVSSRREGDIVRHFQKNAKVEISAKDNSEDIEQFIDIEISKRIDKGQLLGGNPSPSLVGDIKTSLGGKADGVFRWVALSIQALCNPANRHEKDVRLQLGKLPPSLDGVYEIILKQINSGGPWSSLIAKKALRWLLCAQQPLSSTEFRKTLQVGAESSPDTITDEDILGMCCNLVKYDAELDVFRFIHLSAREYLEKAEQDEEYGVSISNASVALACIMTCWTDPHLTYQRNTSRKVRNNTFVDYSRIYWAFHCELSGPYQSEGELGKTMREFLASRKGRPTRRWIQWKDAWGRSWRNMFDAPHLHENLDSRLSACYSRPEDPISVACTFGLLDIVRERAKTGIPNFQDTSAFDLAVKAGQRKIADFLLSELSGQIAIDERALGSVINASQKTLALYLLQQNPSLKITTAIIEEAVSRSDDEMIEFVFESAPPGFAITPELLHGAVANRSSSERLIHDLFKLNPKLLVDEGLLITACSNDKQGLKVLEIILPKYKGQISEDILEACANNSKCAAAMLKFLFSKNLLSKPTTKMIEKAASNYTSEPVQILLERDQNVFVSHEAIMRATGNEYAGLEILSLLLPRISSDLIDEDVLFSAVSNEQYGFEMVQLLLKQSDGFTVTDDVFIEATYYNSASDSRILEELFTHFPRTATISMIKAAMTGIDPIGTVDFLLQQSEGLEVPLHIISVGLSDSQHAVAIFDYFQSRGHKLEMTSEVISGLSYSYSAFDILQRFKTHGILCHSVKLLESIVLNPLGDKICEFLFSTGEQEISPEAVQQCVRNTSVAVEILRLLLGQPQDIEFSEDILERALFVASDPTAIDILLSSGKELKFDEYVTLAAATNKDCGAHLLKMILDDNRAVKPTAIIIETVLSTTWVNPDTFKVLLDASAPESVTRNAFKYALGLNQNREAVILELLKKNPEIGLENDELDLVMHENDKWNSNGQPHDVSQILELFLTMRDDFLITERLLKKLVRYDRPLTALKIILAYVDGRGESLPITEEILEAALRTSSLDSHQVVNLLHDRLISQGSLLVVNENLVTAAALCGSQTEKMLRILLKHSQPIITQRIMHAILRHCWDSLNVLEIFRNLSLEQFSNFAQPDDFFKAYVCNLASSPRGLRRLMTFAPSLPLSCSKDILCAAAAASAEILEETLHIFQRQGQQDILAPLLVEEVVESALSAVTNGGSEPGEHVRRLRLLQRTFKEHGKELPVTGRILTLALKSGLISMWSMDNTRYIIRILKRQARTHLIPGLITEEVLLCANDNLQDFCTLIEPFMPSSQIYALFTERLMSSIAGYGAGSATLDFVYENASPSIPTPLLYFNRITQLIYSILDSDLMCTRFHCTNGTYLNAPNLAGLTPLMQAVDLCFIGCVSVLVEYVHEDPVKGVDINAVCKKGRTALALAARKDLVHIVRMLLEAGARTDIRDKKGRTAEEAARKKGNYMIAKMITKCEAESEKDDVVVALRERDKRRDIRIEELARRFQMFDSGTKDPGAKLSLRVAQTF